MATKENIIIEYTVDTTQLESAIDLMLRLGQVDKKTADDFKAATKSYNERTNAINQQTAAIEGEEKALQGLNQVAKKSMEGILNASQAELVEGALLGIQDALDEVGLSAKELSGAPAKSLRDVTKEIKALQAEAAQLAAKGDILGADKAIRKAGELQDKIGDLRAATKAYASDTRKLDAVVQGITAVSSAYQVAAGAQALLGGNSKEWEKTLIKLNAVMAVTNGLQQIQSLLQKETALSTTILIPLQKAWTLALGQSAGAMRLLRAALISTGLGAIVVLIGTLVANWEKLTNAIYDTFPALKGVKEFFTNFKAYALGTIASTIESFKVLGEIIKDVFTFDWDELEKDWKEGFKRISKAGVEAFDAQTKKSALEESIKTRKFQLDLLEAQGKDVLAKRLQLTKDELTLLEKNSDEYNAKLIEIERIRTEMREKAAEKRKEEAKRLADSLKGIEGRGFDDAQQKRDEEYLKRKKEIEKAAKKGAEDEMQRLADIVNANFKTQEQIAKNEKYWDGKKAADKKQLVEDIKNYTVSQFETISQAIFQINQNRRQEELGNALSALEEEKNKLLANKRLTEKKRAAIEEEYRKKEAQIKTDAFKKDQQARVTEAIIAGALAVVKALPNYVLAAAAAVTTAAQVAVIKSQPVPKFAKGVERLTGAGTETSDSIHAMLSRGERVVPARINEKYFPALTAIHNGKVTPEYANAMLSMPEYIGLDNKSALLLSASRNTLDYKELSRHLAHELKESNEGVIDTLRDGIYVKNLKELKSSNNYDIRRR